MYFDSEFIELDEVVELFNLYGTANQWEMHGIIPYLEYDRVYPSTVLGWVKQGIIPHPHHRIYSLVFFDRQTILDLVTGVTEPEASNDTIETQYKRATSYI